MKRTLEQAQAELLRCHDELTEAKSRDQRLREQLLEVKQAQLLAETDLERKRKAANAAQAEVDAFQPRAAIVYSPDSRIAAVIIKRTPRTITVRHFGLVDSLPREFRLNAKTGDWTEWPAPKRLRFHRPKPATLWVAEQ